MSSLASLPVGLQKPQTKESTTLLKTRQEVLSRKTSAVALEKFESGIRFNYSDLLQAAYEGPKERVQTVLSQGVDIKGADDKTGLTALYAATAKEHADSCQTIQKLAR